MPYGRHWEWRGFGQLEKELRERISRLAPVLPLARTITDRYLWAPGLETNIKLRTWEGGASLKFKHRVQADEKAGLELWLEQPNEDYAFPLSAEAMHYLAAALPIDPPLPAMTSDPAELLSWLAGRGIGVVRVRKRRQLYSLGQGDLQCYVELADISIPARVQTVGIENCQSLSEESTSTQLDLARQAVVDARQSLGMPGGFESASYLQAVARWAKKL